VFGGKLRSGGGSREGFDPDLPFDADSDRQRQTSKLGQALAIPPGAAE
jgi:hypothetical protein